VARDLELAGSRLHTRVLTIYGGTGYDEQLAALKKGVDVAVGTPGRLLDLVNRRALDLSHIEVLVLDEFTANLNTDLEARIRTNLERDLPGLTIIEITHRLEHLDSADRVFEFDRGRVIARAGPR